MKETTFHFVLKISQEQRTNVVGELTATLGGIAGVTNVAADESRYGVDLGVGARIADSVAAKKLHRKIMKTSIANKNAMIVEVRTMLTDVF